MESRKLVEDKETWLPIERINLMVVLTGKKQSDIARKLGIGKQSLNHYLTGKRKFDLIAQKGICDMFDVPHKIFTQHTVHLVLKGDKLIVL